MGKNRLKEIIKISCPVIGLKNPFILKKTNTDNYLPAILEPNFDLLWLDMGENGAFSDELLTAQGTGFGAFMIKSL